MQTLIYIIVLLRYFVNMIYIIVLLRYLVCMSKYYEIRNNFIYTVLCTFVWHIRCCDDDTGIIFLF